MEMSLLWPTSLPTHSTAAQQADGSGSCRRPPHQICFKQPPAGLSMCSSTGHILPLTTQALEEKCGKPAVNIIIWNAAVQWQTTHRWCWSRCFQFLKVNLQYGKWCLDLQWWLASYQGQRSCWLIKNLSLQVLWAKLVWRIYLVSGIFYSSRQKFLLSHFSLLLMTGLGKRVNYLKGIRKQYFLSESSSKSQTCNRMWLCVAW